MKVLMDLEDIVKVNDTIDKNHEKNVLLVKELFTNNILTKDDIRKNITLLSKKYKVLPSMVKILYIYRSLVTNNELEYDQNIETLLRTKNVRSLSGVVVITSFTSPYPVTSAGMQKFSCEYDCHYCPKQPDQPRSYLLNEPGVLRANHNNFDSKKQFWARATSYINMGHPLDKIEIIISGGTLSSYPKEYIVEFVRDQFYAANVTYCKIAKRELRETKSLEEEQYINQHQSLVKIIGITVETRPDRINNKELVFFRQLGVTRVQIGVQHIDDRILNHINRKCSNHHTIKAIKLLKETGFKVDIHLMPDLPHPQDISQQEMVELDRNMFEQVTENPEYQADQWKIYPCATIPWTEIEKWYQSGLYKPYAEVKTDNDSDLLFDLLIDIKQKVKPWVRLNRIIRDIPTTYLIGGYDNISMRGDLLNHLHKMGLTCNCIRCREIKNKDININDFKIKVRDYQASGGIEYFISWEDDNDILLGFLRLRINMNEKNRFFPELHNCSLIRELHIYGQVINHKATNNGTGVQHIGLGKQLLNKAIEISQDFGLNKIAVISGVGVRNYYIKQGFVACDYYEEDNIQHKTYGNFLIKNIEYKKQNNDINNNNINYNDNIYIDIEIININYLQLLLIIIIALVIYYLL